jgi:hypothetical protein
MDEKTNKIRSVRDLNVYKKAFDTAMEIFEISKSFPKEEKYSLTDQIRRSSRQYACPVDRRSLRDANLAEGWRKRRYKPVFINKLSDSIAEAAESQTWLEFALACKYVDKDKFDQLDEKYEHIFAMLHTMENKADSFCKKSS